MCVHVCVCAAIGYMLMYMYVSGRARGDNLIINNNGKAEVYQVHNTVDPH